MADFDWKTLVRTVAPSIASVFGTPLAGMGVTALLNVLLPPDAARPAPGDAEDVIKQALLGANPDLMMKVKQAEQQFLLDMKRLDIDLEKTLDQLDVQDRSNARDLKVNWLKTDKWDYEPVLAALVLVAFGYAEFWVFGYASSTVEPMDANKAMLVGKMLGMIDAGFMALVLFRWGSSKSSERKTEIAAQTEAQKIDAGKVN